MNERDNRPLRIAWITALAVHLVGFMVVVPVGASRVDALPEREAVVIRRLPPPKKPDRPEPVKRRVRRAPSVPIPDPTPDEPEILVQEVEYEVFVAEPVDIEFAISAPIAPPVQELAVYRGGVDVEKPRILEKVSPVYPELAQRARLECVAVLEARIDRVGNVIDVRALRSCPLGMDAAAIDAVSRWKYAPTLVDGRPVEVLLNVTVRFRLGAS